MKSKIKMIAQNVFNLFGLQLSRVSPSHREPPSVYLRRGHRLLRYAQEAGVDVLVDIGANEGQYAAAFRQIGFRKRIISFEPLPVPFSKLAERTRQQPEWLCRQLAIGDEEKEVTIHLAGNSESSSVLPMLPLHVAAYPASEYIGEQKARLTRIDKVLPGLTSEKDRLMLKIDIQGLELQALLGAVKTLPRVQLIDIELSLTALYAGQATLVEVIHFLSLNGFAPISIENAFTDPRNDHTLQVDAVFLRQTPQA